MGDGSDADAGDDGDGVGADGQDKARSEEDVCAWCRESEDKTLFLCDGDDCGRFVCVCVCVHLRIFWHVPNVGVKRWTDKFSISSACLSHRTF